jgi:DNA-binding transcriptional regulator YhcF (GntR family)
MPTSKKIRVIGTRQYINAETNEIEDFNVISEEDQDFNFDKFWIAQIMFAIDEFGSQKMKLLLYLITIRERANNTVLKTVSEIAKETNINKNTIVATLKILEKHKIIRRKTGVIFISPDVIFKGGHNKRMNVLIQYRAVSQNEQEETKPKELKPTTAADLAAIPGLAVKNQIKPENAGVKNEIRNEYNNNERESFG